MVEESLTGITSILLSKRTANDIVVEVAEAILSGTPVTSLPSLPLSSIYEK